MKNHNDCQYVADTRDGFENEQADTQWLFDVHYCFKLDEVKSILNKYHTE